MTFVPSFVLVSRSAGWTTLRALIVPGLFSGFTVFLFRQYFLALPAGTGGGRPGGRVDPLGRVLADRGAQLAGFFAAIAVITVIGSWNAFLWPLMIAQSPDSWTVQVALSGCSTAHNLH